MMIKNILKVFFIFSICVLYSCSSNKKTYSENIVIGVSSALGDTVWSKQMIDDAKTAALDYPFISKMIIENAPVSPKGQIDQIKKLIDANCNIIIIDPSAGDILLPVISEALKKGITVIGIGAGIDLKGVVNVCVNQKMIAEIYALWMAESISGTGEIIAVNGLENHPVNKQRIEGYKNIFNSYPNIKIVEEINCDWDNIKAMQEVQKLLTKYNGISGIFVQEDMSLAVGEVLKNKEMNNVPFTGEAYLRFLDKWSAEEYNTVAVPNPPGNMASAIRISVLLSKGRKLKQNSLSGIYKNTIYLPAGNTISKDNLANTINDLTAKMTLYVDSYITKEEAEGYFE